MQVLSITKSGFASFLADHPELHPVYVRMRLWALQTRLFLGIFRAVAIEKFPHLLNLRSRDALRHSSSALVPEPLREAAGSTTATTAAGAVLAPPPGGRRRSCMSGALHEAGGGAAAAVDSIEADERRKKLPALGRQSAAGQRGRMRSCAEDLGIDNVSSTQQQQLRSHPGRRVSSQRRVSVLSSALSMMGNDHQRVRPSPSRGGSQMGGTGSPSTNGAPPPAPSPAAEPGSVQA